MSKIKTREITIKQSKGGFSIGKSSKLSKKDYDFSAMQALRQLLSNEKARMLHVIKTKQPSSIYDLAKKLERGFKAVNDDVKLLQRFGFVELVPEKTKNRTRHKPQIISDNIIINIKI